MMPMVVGRLAAQTPSLLSVRSSMPEATTRGGTHAKQAVSPGMMTCNQPSRFISRKCASQDLSGLQRC